MTLSSKASWAASSTAKRASPRGSSKQTRNAMNESSIAMPAQSRLKKSSEEISLAAFGETNAHTMLAAELSEIRPKTDASFKCTRGAERSPPLSVILNGRPNGLTIALRSVAEIANAVTEWVASMKKGSVRDLEIQVMYIICPSRVGTPYRKNAR